MWTKRHLFKSFFFNPCWSLSQPVLKLSWLWMVRDRMIMHFLVWESEYMLLLEFFSPTLLGDVPWTPGRRWPTKTSWKGGAVHVPVPKMMLNSSRHVLDENNRLLVHSQLWHWPALWLPGMILLPGSFSGKISSPRPERGPDPRKRMSFAIFIRLQAVVFMAPLSSTKASWAARASNLFGAVTKGKPEEKVIMRMR